TADPNNSSRGLLCVNHEQVLDEYIHANGQRNEDANGNRLPPEVVKEMNAHGVSVIEVRDGASGWAYVQNSSFNRRITAFTNMNITGPARGNARLNTAYSAGGTRTRGTLNNCGNGYTPWGTYLTCEENWFSYFRRDSDAAQRSAADNALFARYGMGPDTRGFSYRKWDTAPGDDYTRFDITVKGASAAADYRNEPNTFGYIVEIDPYNPTSTPQKRSALGRFVHEGAWVGPVRAGQPIAFYMGCDSRFEYIYKYVSTALWDPADAVAGLTAGDKYLDNGKLYAAKFNADGSGEWIELGFGLNGLNASNPVFPFASQGDICVATRLAADAVGATRMDRPEWGAVNPVNGEVYMTLTNNTARTGSSASNGTDAANPRNYARSGTGATNGNPNGHTIRWREDGDSVAATAFSWDIYLFGGRADADPALVNISGLTDENDHSSPDGLWFDRRGVLWIQTDDGEFPGAGRSNNQMLAALPGVVGDGATRSIGGQATVVGAPATADKVRRFLVGPVGCEITGIDMTPDSRTMFVNVQHPGEGGAIDDPNSTWPSASRNALVTGEAGNRPRSATIVITRDDGGEIGL
ncbi:MAG: PhoX family protein, partial [Panacagrimonas sp.]